MEILGLHFLPSRHFVPGLQSASCTDPIGITVFVRASLKSGPKYRSSKKNSKSSSLVRLSWPLWLICGLYVEELTRESTMIEQ